MLFSYLAVRSTGTIPDLRTMASSFPDLHAYVGTFSVPRVGVGAPITFAWVTLKTCYRFGGDGVYALSRTLEKSGAGRQYRSLVIEPWLDGPKDLASPRGHHPALNFFMADDTLQPIAENMMVEAVYWMAPVDRTTDNTCRYISVRSGAFQHLQGYATAVSSSKPKP
jgi:hypothetical protein